MKTKSAGEAWALQEILTWSEGKPKWQRDALRRLCNKVSLNESDYDELLAIAKCERSNAQVLTKEHIKSADSLSSTVNLRSISETNNVNALKSGEHLTFRKGPGITAIYGDNGSGKSGYARILKSTCRARIKNNQIIHPNVYSASSGIPHAKIKFSVDDEVQTANWAQGQKTDSRLSAISLFDSKTANVHVDEKNAVAYNPFPLELLKRLSEACMDIKRRLNDQVEELKKQKPQSMENPSCNEDTEVGKLIHKLSATTCPDTVETLGQLSDEEQRKYEKLVRDLAPNQITTVAKITSHKTQLDRHGEEIEKLCEAVSDIALRDIQRMQNEYLKKKQAAEVAAKNLFNGEEHVLHNIGADTWMNLWEAARRYSEEYVYPEQKFPNTEAGARCVLCYQELSSDTVKLLKSFEDFVKDITKEEERTARKKFEDALAFLDQINIPENRISEIFSFIKTDIENERLAESLKKCALDAKCRLQRFKKNPSMDLSNNLLESVFPKEELIHESRNLEEKAHILGSNPDSEIRKRLEKELMELTDRKWLAGVKDDILAEIKRTKQCENLKLLIRECSTNSITAKSSQLAQSLVTDALIKKFAEETEKLNLRTLNLELRHSDTRAGSSRFQISLQRELAGKMNVGAILSEGEFRCVALAAFLAEQATANSKSSIVFDDPVSSLDHVRRERVAERLAEESVSRQVIIFTHDLTFLFSLEEACKKTGANINYQWITRNENNIGLCKTELPLVKKFTSNAINGLGEHLCNVRASYERGDITKWEQETAYFQKELRILWERAVEEVVPTVKRFRNQIETGSLVKLTAITQEDCAKMRSEYRKCSEFLHSEAASLNNALPSPKEIKNQIDSLKNWFDKIKEKQNKIRSV